MSYKKIKTKKSVAKGICFFRENRRMCLCVVWSVYFPYLICLFRRWISGCIYLCQILKHSCLYTKYLHAHVPFKKKTIFISKETGEQRHCLHIYAYGKSFHFIPLLLCRYLFVSGMSKTNVISDVRDSSFHKFYLKFFKIFKKKIICKTKIVVFYWLNVSYPIDSLPKIELINLMFLLSASFRLFLIYLTW